MDRLINSWDKGTTKTAIKSWGKLFEDHTLSMFNFCLPSNSFLDLGCGFGRFLEHLLKYKKEDFTYTGYDGSIAMLEELKKKFPKYKDSLYIHNITEPFKHSDSCVILSDVFIHTLFKDQLKALDNIAAIAPQRLTFDINNLGGSERDGEELVVERLNSKNFRVVRQDPEMTYNELVKRFPNYTITFQHFETKRRPNAFVFKVEKND